MISQYLKNKTVIHYFKQKLTANGLMVVLFCLTNKNAIDQGTICPFRGNAHEFSHEQVPQYFDLVNLKKGNAWWSFYYFYFARTEVTIIIIIITIIQSQLL